MSNPDIHNQSENNIGLIPLNPKMFKISNENTNILNRTEFNNIRFYYHEHNISKFDFKGKKFRIADKRIISIPGLLSNPKNALYRSEIVKETLKLIQEKQPSIIIYIYDSFATVISYKEENPSGLVELFFIRYFLVPLD